MFKRCLFIASLSDVWSLPVDSDYAQKYRSEKQSNTRSRRARSITQGTKFCNYPQDDHENCVEPRGYGSYVSDDETEGFWETMHPYSGGRDDVWNIGQFV